MSPVLFVSVCCVHRAEQPTPNHWTPVPLDTSDTGVQWPWSGIEGVEDSSDETGGCFLVPGWQSLCKHAVQIC